MKKKIILAIISISIMALLIINSQASLEGARNGLLLWYRTLFPTLMPFMVLSNFIVLTGAASYIGKIFAPLTRFLRLPACAGYCIIVGLLCGYPMGAYVCCSLNAVGDLSDRDLDYLAPLCNNVSPMFMVSYIALSCLKSRAVIFYIILVLVGGTIVSMVLMRLPAILRRYASSKNTLRSDSAAADVYAAASVTVSAADTPTETAAASATVSVLDTSTPSEHHGLSTAKALNTSISNTITASLKLCIFVMLFSVIGSIIGTIDIFSDITKAGLISLCEITAGLNQFAAIDLPFKTKFLIMTAFTSFGGLSSVFQTMSLADDSHFNTGKYIAHKLVIGIITCLIGIIAIICMPNV